MHSSRINGEGELRGQPASPGSPGKWPLNWSVCVCLSLYVFQSSVETVITTLDPGMKDVICMFHSYLFSYFRQVKKSVCFCVERLFNSGAVFHGLNVHHSISLQ